MDLQLTNKRALVTGSTAGIGFAIASLLGQEGASVVVNGRSQRRVEQAVQRIRAERKDAQVTGVTADLGTKEGVEVRSGAAERTLEGSDILVATGRTPNTDQLDVAKAGVELDSRGYIRVNDKLQTTAPDVWATGECAGSPQFTHVGEDDCRVVLDNLAGGSRTTRDRLIPYCLFTDPELAHVGMNESEAAANDVPYRIARMPMSLVLRTRTLSQTRGFMKALIGGDDRILGFTAFGAEASEQMAVVQTAMLGGMPYTALRDAIFTHPTAAEGLVGLFASPPSAPGPRQSDSHR